MKRPSAYLVLLSLFSPAYSIAEGGCPPGQFPQAGQGWQTCIPMPNYSGGASSPQMPSEVWEDRYGSLATDSMAGVIGSSSNQPTRAGAEAEAMFQCTLAGGTDCLMQGSYGNECLAMALGPNSFLLRNGATKAAAEKKALDDCAKENDTCGIYHSSCSFPVRIR
ncbi:DUF4189 domain-containing protein [Luteibacter sp. CQ10]|uniref:DUF4189 domain-containing protein n=1 Tax=Luteibacter sp. CQ10 TaxID=2805821 RepID=UPI0034A0FFEA